MTIATEQARRARKAAYMREYGKSRVRTKQQRHAEYIRRKDKVEADYRARKDTIDYAKKVVSQQTGLKLSEVPEDLAKAKLTHLLMQRTLREREQKELPPRLASEYLNGNMTIGALAAKFRIDRFRATEMLKAQGAFPRPRSKTCANGHLWSEGNNLALTREGYRRCRKCCAAAARRSLRKRQAKES